MKPQLTVQQVNGLYRELAGNWEDVALWQVERGPHQAKVSGALTGREQEIVQDRNLSAPFVFMAYLLSAG